MMIRESAKISVDVHQECLRDPKIIERTLDSALYRLNEVQNSFMTHLPKDVLNQPPVMQELAQIHTLQADMLKSKAVMVTLQQQRTASSD